MKEKFNISSAKLYEKFYNPEKLFNKIGKAGKKAGIKTIYSALLLYYALFDGEVPMAQKALVIGALGYFILPLDFIPDIMGPMGFTDDASAMLLALQSIWNNITPATEEKARHRLQTWFGSVSENDLKLFK